MIKSCWPRSSLTSKYSSCVVFKLILIIGLEMVALFTQCQQQFVPMLAGSSAGMNRVQLQQLANNYPIERRSQIIVPGNAALVRDASRVDRIVLPNEQPLAKQAFEQQQQQQQQQNQSIDLSKASYVIDHKRFVEYVTTRCFASTILDDPDSLEPSFVIIKPSSEIRLNATAPAKAILGAGFEARKPTTLVIHGFTQSYPSTDWLRHLRALFEINSQISKQNLIIMDWGTASHGSYAQVAARANGIGSFLANFLMKLIEELGADRMQLHLIGHSLGAHVAGFAGKRIWPRVGRITALDPAGPCFGKLFSNSPEDRLGPDDAYEVDVYHYDDDFLGLPGQIGQFDVFVNGGSSQPGAKDNVNSMLDAVITMIFRRNRVLSESHTRSTEVPTVQLAPSGCQEVAFECRDWPAFLSGECGKCDQLNGQCHMMGFKFQYGPDRALDSMPLRTSYPGKRFYLATSAAEQFCLNHHQILLKFEPNSELAQQARRMRWRLHLELFNELNERINVTLTNQMLPNVFSYLLLSPARPIKFRAALLQVRQSDNSLVPLRERQKTSHALYGPAAAPPNNNNNNMAPARVNMIEINFMSNINLNYRQALSSNLCPTNWFQMSNAPANYNSIDDASLVADDWLSFEECQQ